MKKVIFTIIFSAILPFAGFTQTTPYKGGVSVTIASPTVADGQATYRAEVDFSAIRLSSMQMIELIPVVGAADGVKQEQFAPVIIMGKQRARIIDRDKRLNGYQWPIEPSQVIVLKSRSERRAQIAVTVPYQEGAKLTIVEKTLSGNDKLREYGPGLLSYTHTPSTPSIISAPRPSAQPQVVATVRKPAQAQTQENRRPTQQVPYRPEYRISNISAPVTTRTESYTSRLSFAQNNTLINRTLGDNAVTLAATDARIRAILSDPLQTIIGITVKGFASPEGEAEGNHNLAAERARTFVNYLGNVHNLRSPNIKITVTGVGEDWGGLRNLVENSTIDDRYRILDALDNYADTYQRRTALQELNSGVTYAILLNYYSALRRVEYTIEYSVAESVSAMTESYDAIKEIQNGNYDTVIVRMNALNTPQALNNIGVCYWCKGDYERALDYFRRSADAGSQDAKHNIQQYYLWSEGQK